MQTIAALIAEVEIVHVASACLFRADERCLPTAFLSSLDTEDAVYAAAAESQAAFNRMMGEVAAKIGGKAKTGSLKGRERAAQKVAADYAGDWRRLHDVLRGTIIVAGVAQIRDAVRELRRRMTAAGWTLAKCPKNRFETPTVGGYRDLNLSFVAPNGCVCEVQINLESMMSLKKVLHAVYEDVRNIEAAASGRSLTAAEAARIQTLNDQMKVAYNATWRVAGGAA